MVLTLPPSKINDKLLHLNIYEQICNPSSEYYNPATAVSHHVLTCHAFFFFFFTSIYLILHKMLVFFLRLEYEIHLYYKSRKL